MNNKEDEKKEQPKDSITSEENKPTSPEYKNYEKVLGFDRASNRPLVISKWSFTIDKKLRIKYRKE